MNVTAIKNAGMEALWFTAGMASLEFLNSGKLPEAIVAAVLSLGLMYAKYHIRTQSE